MGREEGRRVQDGDLTLSTGQDTNAIISLDRSFKCKEKHAYWHRRLCYMYMTDPYVGF